MKKIIFTLILSILMCNSVSARGVYEKELPSKFRNECFEFSSSYNFLKQDDAKYKITLNKKDTIAVKNGYLIPIIPYKIVGSHFQYTTKSFTNQSYVADNNSSTSIELDTEKSKEIILRFNDIIKKNTFGLKFKHSAEMYIPELYISEDGTRFSPVSFSSIYDFNIKVLKIKFVKKYRSAKREKIKISELNFFKQENINLMRISGGGRIDFYSNYTCADYINLNTIHIPFEIDINTPIVKIDLKKNVDYNPNVDKDTDVDGIENHKDNCLETYNPLQKDSNADGRGDKCSDVDGDGIVGSKDNCPTISNSDQKDINLNSIGDVCEFDKDKDGIFDGVDNCITIANALQKDSDNDGIGNMCDNCKVFNPSQIDEDSNNIGDVCDSQNKLLAENDDDNDGIINGKDNCKIIANPEQEDFDKDGVGDSCDNCMKIKNKNQYDFNKNNIGDICEDSDGDGVEGIQDNCMNVANKNQKDSDNDGIGDVCEDDDNDDIWFANDNCPTIYNPLQKDMDNDGLGNVCDAEDNRTLESNSTLFIGILIIIVLLFGGGIYMMSKKIGNQPNNKAPLPKIKKTVKKKIKTKKTKLIKVGDELFESYTDKKRRESEK